MTYFVLFALGLYCGVICDSHNDAVSGLDYVVSKILMTPNLRGKLPRSTE
jgi:hypothetical protein